MSLLRSAYYTPNLQSEAFCPFCGMTNLTLDHVGHVTVPGKRVISCIEARMGYYVLCLNFECPKLCNALHHMNSGCSVWLWVATAVA